MSIRQRLLPLLLATTLLQAAPGWAGEAGQEPFRLSGFATLGVTWSGNEELGFRRDLYREGLFDGDASVKADSILGLQLDARFTDALGGAIQLVGKDRLEDSLENSVEWAYLRYQIDPQWQVRVGRIGLDIYLLSEYRSLGFSYLWTRPPMEFYTTVPYDSFDGLDITWTRPLGSGQLRAKVHAGETANDFLVASEVVELKLGPIYGASLVWETDTWQWRVTAATNEIDEPTGYFPATDELAEQLLTLAPFWPQAEELAASLEVDNKHFYYYSAGFAYNSEFWQVQAEVGRVDSGVGAYPTIDNGYLSVGRKLGPVTLFTVLASAAGADERSPRHRRRWKPSSPSCNRCGTVSTWSRTPSAWVCAGICVTTWRSRSSGIAPGWISTAWACGTAASCRMTMRSWIPFPST